MRRSRPMRISLLALLICAIAVASQAQDFIRYYPPSSSSVLTHASDQVTPILQFKGPGVYGNFNFASFDFGNDGDTRANRVYVFGYNCANSGTPVADAAICFSFESHYAPDANRYVEGHWVYQASGGTPAIRAFTWAANTGTNKVSSSINGDSFAIYGQVAGLPTFQWSNDNKDMYYANGATIRRDTAPDGTAAITQRNAAGGGYVGLIGLSATDEVLLPSGGATAYHVRTAARVVSTLDARTIASNGGGTAATLTLEPTQNIVTLTCNDTDGCDITMGESLAYTGALITIINIGTNVCNFADTAGVSELAGVFAMGQYDVLRLAYVASTWVEVGRSNN